LKGSKNVSDDGYYSLQVVRQALKTKQITCESVETDSAEVEDPNQEKAFLFHSADHFYSIRKIDGIWYDLNSLSKEGPKIISNFYLRY
jgi:Ataxin-3